MEINELRHQMSDNIDRALRLGPLILHSDARKLLMATQAAVDEEVPASDAFLALVQSKLERNKSKRSS